MIGTPCCIVKLARSLNWDIQDPCPGSDGALRGDPLPQQSLPGAVSAGGQSGTFGSEDTDTTVLILSTAPPVHVVPTSAHVVIRVREILPEAFIGPLGGGVEGLGARRRPGELFHSVVSWSWVCHRTGTLRDSTAVNPLRWLLSKVVQGAELPLLSQMLVIPLLHKGLDGIMSRPQCVPLNLLSSQMSIRHSISALAGEEVVGSSLAGFRTNAFVYRALNPVERRAKSASKGELECSSFPTIIQHSNCPKRLLGSLLKA